MDVPYSVFADPPERLEAAKSLPKLPRTDYDSWLRSQGLRSRPVSEELVSFGATRPEGKGAQWEHEFLKSKVPVLCLILSKGRGKAKAVKDTWGSWFMSS